MDPAIGQFLTAIGLARYIELAGVVVMLCSALDAAIPQPASGSHWLPVRKLLSWFALNLNHASPGDQPSIASWFLRIAQAVMAAGLLKTAQDQGPQANPLPAPAVPASPVVHVTPPADPVPAAPPPAPAA
jgi:hypothetical protein